jgi:diacylglycerol kinase (ATP)
MVNERANRMTCHRGRSRYNVENLAELRTFRPVPYVNELDGTRWETDAILVAVGKGPTNRGGMLV